jgi:hypothetical protein
MEEARLAEGLWRPQIAIADERDWPDGYTQGGIAEITNVFSR